MSVPEVVQLHQLERGHFWARVRGQTFDVVKIGQAWRCTTRTLHDPYPVEVCDEVRTLRAAQDAIVAYICEHDEARRS